jgi:hypothetical protein
MREILNVFDNRAHIIEQFMSLATDLFGPHSSGTLSKATAGILAVHSVSRLTFKTLVGAR